MRRSNMTSHELWVCFYRVRGRNRALGNTVARALNAPVATPDAALLRLRRGR